ncbi:MAG: SWIM zinc finger family protein, partial [Pseudomonadota bacterium]
KSRERHRAKREAGILEGLDDLERWLGDVLQQGLAAFPAHAAQQCSVLARRLVDAKAGGLAKRLESFPASYFDTPEPERADTLIEFLGQLHLLASAYRRQEHLPAPMRYEVRRLIGWTQTREELLQSEHTLRVAGRWFVLAVRRRTQPDRLVRIESWLRRLEGAEHDANPQTAVLMDFVPVAMASNAAPAYARGQTLDATLAFYPSATPLLALVAEHRTLSDEPPLPTPPQHLPEALADYRQQLARSPWLTRWPIAFQEADLRQDPLGTYWFHSQVGEDERALRVHPDAREGVSTLAGLESIGVYALHDGRHCWPLAATTALGPWWGVSDG